MLELVLLVLLSIVTSRLLEKNYKVAYIAHSVLFIFLVAVFFFTTDIPVIQNMMINWMGEDYYESLYDSIRGTTYIINLGLSGIVVMEIVILVMLPLLSVVAFIQYVRDQFKEMKLKTSFEYLIPSFITLVEYPEKDFRHTQNETYLILGKLLN